MKATETPDKLKKKAMPASSHSDQLILKKALLGSLEFVKYLAKNPYEELITLKTPTSLETVDLWQSMSMPVTRLINAANDMESSKFKLKNEKLISLINSKKQVDKKQYLREISHRVIKTLSHDLAFKSYFSSKNSPGKNFNVLMAAKFFYKDLFDEFTRKKGIIEVHKDEDLIIASIAEGTELSHILRNYVANYSLTEKCFTMDFPCQSAVKITSLFATFLEEKIMKMNI